jgi:hypothetical protein
MEMKDFDRYSWIGPPTGFEPLEIVDAEEFVQFGQQRAIAGKRQEKEQM